MFRITWDFVRERAVGVLGERAVGTIEESFEIFQIIREEGMGGAWEYLKEQFGDLQETIMGTITEMLVSEVVEAGIKYLLAMLTPAGAFVKAAMMIVDVAKFFIEKGSQIMELVDAFVQSVSAIAAGSVGKVAEMIERALSLSVPLLIGMFTSLLGLGDLAAKVTKIFKNIKGRVTGAVDGFIEKAGTWFKDKKGRRKERKEKKDKEKAEKNKKDRPSKLEAGKDKNKEENNDQRNDKQKKTAFDKGMKLGAAVVNNENLSNQEIKVELNQLELKYKLKELDAKLISEKEDLQTWVLSGQLDEHKGSKTIERKGENQGIFHDIKEVFTLAGEQHTLSVEQTNERYEVYMASDKDKLDARLAPFQQTVERYKTLFAQKESQGKLTEEEEYFLLELEDMLKGNNSISGLSTDIDSFKQRINSKGSDKLNTKTRKSFFQEVDQWINNAIKKIIDLATSDDFKLDDLSPKALQEAAEALEQEQQQQLKLSTIKDVFPNTDLSGLNTDKLLKNILLIQTEHAFDKLEDVYFDKNKDIQDEIDKLTRKLSPEDYQKVKKTIKNGTQALRKTVENFGEEAVAKELAKLTVRTNHLNLVRKELSKKVNIKYIDYTKDQKEMTEEQLEFSQEVIIEGHNLLEYKNNRNSINSRTIAAVELRGEKSDLLFGGGNELYVSGGGKYAYEDTDGKKKQTETGDKANSLGDLTHQVFEAKNHHGHRNSDTEVKIFERLTEFLRKNKDKISPKNKIRIFVRYDACPSCQTMMYKIKEAADSGDPRFDSLRGVVVEVIHANKNIFNKLI